MSRHGIISVMDSMGVWGLFETLYDIVKMLDSYRKEAVEMAYSVGGNGLKAPL